MSDMHASAFQFAADGERFAELRKATSLTTGIGARRKCERQRAHTRGDVKRDRRCSPAMLANAARPSEQDRCHQSTSSGAELGFGRILKPGPGLTPPGCVLGSVEAAELSSGLERRSSPFPCWTSPPSAADEVQPPTPCASSSSDPPAQTSGAGRDGQ